MEEKLKRNSTPKPRPVRYRSREAKAVLGNIGNDRLYELIAAGKLDSYMDGRFRYVTAESIDRYNAELLAAQAPPLRERPRRLAEQSQHQK